jgi:hypothetical protein
MIKQSKPPQTSRVRSILTFICVLCILSIIPLGISWFGTGCCGASTQQVHKSSRYGQFALGLPILGLIGLVAIYSDRRYDTEAKNSWGNTSVSKPSKAKKK